MRRRTRQTAGSVLPPLLAGVVLLGVIVLIVAARRHGAGSARFAVDPAHVAVVSAPDWMPAELASELAEHLARELGPPVSLMDDEGLSAWARDLPDLASWIAAVERVEPSFPGQAEVHLRLRRPVLVLAGDLLVSGDGQRVGYGDLPGAPRPLHLQGPADGEDVLECAASAAELLPYRGELAEAGLRIDRVGVEGQGEVVFLTATGVELEWGRSARKSEFSALDLPARARVDNLLTVLRRRPGLPGVRRIVLWRDRPEVVLEGG